MDKVILKLVNRFKTNDPYIIAEGLNIHVRQADLGVGTRGIYYRKLRRRFIVLHDGLSEEWKRFVCAHELGHDRMHPGFSQFWLEEHSLFNVGKYERQANKFAVRLLTSGDYPKLGDTIGELLRRNDVPQEMQKFYY
jgi:Zn-dependent peptidase ImmA (M78 family)